MVTLICDFAERLDTKMLEVGRPNQSTNTVLITRNRIFISGSTPTQEPTTSGPPPGGKYHH